MSEVTPIVEATANVVEVTATVLRNATYLERARQIASAHPIAAGAVAVAVSATAAYGTWTLARKICKKRKAAKAGKLTGL